MSRSRKPLIPDGAEWKGCCFKCVGGHLHIKNVVAKVIQRGAQV